MNEMTSSTATRDAFPLAAIGSGMLPLVCGLAAFWFLAFSQSTAHAEDTRVRTLPGHVPPALARLSPTGTLPGEYRLNLAIGLPVRDEKALNEFLERLYDPGSPEFRHYLTPETFTEKFGPTEAQYAAVIALAEKRGFAILAKHGNRLVLDVNGSVADIQRAFNITLRTYRHPIESRDFYAPDTAPTVDDQVPVADISGLNNYVLPHPRSLRPGSSSPPLHAAPRSGSGSGGTYVGSDFRAAYLPGVSLTGVGQVLGLFEFDGFYSSDITAYESTASLPAVPIQTVLLDGFDGTPTRGRNSGDAEVSLDIEMAISMAPGLAGVVVFEAGPNGLQNDILNAMASSNQIKQFSCSWGWGGGPSATTDNIFKQMASQGQSFFTASGDSDAYTAGQVDDPNQAGAPSSCPFITVVGGTTLATDSGGLWSSETVWNAGGGEGSGGGISSYYAIPSWQLGVNMTANGGSMAYRNIPDVAANADNVYITYGNGRSESVVGTSCAAPLWAALTALINQESIAAGRGSVGFLNPAIYAIGKSANYNSSFHDITVGNNTWSSSPNSYYAASGYDLCTGWGTPAGRNLIDALAGPPDPLGISPATGFTAFGAVGGPFSPVTTTFVLTNSGASALSWSLLNPASWLEASLTQGQLPPRGATNVTVVLAALANGLGAGTYSATTVFSNWDSTVSQYASFALEVGQSLVQNGGFETGDFTGWTLAGNTIIGSTVYNAVQSSGNDPSVVHSGTYGAFLGDNQVADLSQTLATIPGQAYRLSFWLDNPTNGPQQEFIASWLVNGATPGILYAVTNPPVLPWTNLQFVVTAGASNSVLRFQAENVPYGFGLDDVALTPISSPAFESVIPGATGLILTWRTQSGLSYQVQYATSLVAPNWTDLATPIAGSGSLSTLADPAPGATQRFYRLVAFP